MSSNHNSLWKNLPCVTATGYSPRLLYHEDLKYIIKHVFGYIYVYPYFWRRFCDYSNCQLNSFHPIYKECRFKSKIFSLLPDLGPANFESVKSSMWIWGAPSRKDRKVTIAWELRSRWWFQTVFIFTPIWGRFPIWLIFFRWVETTN